MVQIYYYWSQFCEVCSQIRIVDLLLFRYCLYRIWGEMCFYLMLVLWTLDYSAVLLQEKVEKMNLGFLLRFFYPLGYG